MIRRRDNDPVPVHVTHALTCVLCDLTITLCLSRATVMMVREDMKAATQGTVFTSLNINTRQVLSTGEIPTCRTGVSVTGGTAC